MSQTSGSTPPRHSRGHRGAPAAGQGTLFAAPGWAARVAVLGSGSRGNAVVLESGGRRLLIDAGFSARQLEQRLELLGSRGSDIDAILLTHEHRDHTVGVDVFVRRHQIPVYATAGTLEGTRLQKGARSRSRVIASGTPFEVAGFEVEPFSIPHDAREPVGFVVEDASGCRVGLVADLGARSQLAWGRLRDLDLLVLETNHDLQMLRNGPYPRALTQRVAGRHGHLSNREAADGLPDLLSDRLKALVLYHLSRTNNSPALAAEAIEARLDAEGSRAEIIVSDQHEPTSWIEVGLTH
ncbi:MAG: MBL fold metallo-hydrolase [Acidobacteriota bacterium]